MEEYGITDEDLSGEENSPVKVDYLKIIASDEDDSTVRLLGAVNTDIETMSGDVCIEINDSDDLALRIGWYGGWRPDNDFFIPEGVVYERNGNRLEVIWKLNLDNLKKISWHVYH